MSIESTPRKAFNIIELAALIAIIVIIAGLLFPFIREKKAQEPGPAAPPTQEVTVERYLTISSGYRFGTVTVLPTGERVLLLTDGAILLPPLPTAKLER